MSFIVSVCVFRYIHYPAAGGRSRRRAVDFRCGRGRGHAVFRCAGDDWGGVAETAARQGGAENDEQMVKEMNDCPTGADTSDVMLLFVCVLLFLSLQTKSEMQVEFSVSDSQGVS